MTSLDRSDANAFINFHLWNSRSNSAAKLSFILAVIQVLESYSKIKIKARLFIYRLANLIGKWLKEFLYWIYWGDEVSFLDKSEQIDETYKNYYTT